MKKNVIRLTESQLHQVIKESVKKIIKEASYSGYVNPDGNYRTGGHWSHSEGYSQLTVSGDEIVDLISDKVLANEVYGEEGESLFEQLSNLIDGKEYNFVAMFASGSDESVGLSPYHDFEGMTDYDGLDEDLRQVLPEDLVSKALEVVENEFAESDGWN